MAKPCEPNTTNRTSPVFLIGLAVVLLLVCIGATAALILKPEPTPLLNDPVGTTVSSTTTSSTASSTTVSSTTETGSAGSTTTSSTKPTTTTTTLYTPPINPGAEKKLVALTFDDGPGKYTNELLDILQKEQVPATFFLLGNRVSGNETIIKRMVKDGHEVGGHSYSHPKLTTLSKSKITKEMTNCKKAIEKVTGVEMALFRAPYGAVNNTVKSCAKAADLKLINWSVDTYDWKVSKENQSYAQSEILKKIFSGKYKVTDGGIVLMHDVHENSVDSVAAVIYYLKQNGYEFVTVSELLDLREDGGEAGVLYRKAEP